MGVFAKSSQFEMLSYLLMQIISEDYRNDPVRVQSQIKLFFHSLYVQGLIKIMGFFSTIRNLITLFFYVQLQGIKCTYLMMASTSFLTWSSRRNFSSQQSFPQFQNRQQDFEHLVIAQYSNVASISFYYDNFAILLLERNCSSTNQDLEYSFFEQNMKPNPKIYKYYKTQYQMFQNRFDEFYLTICKEVGGIEGLVKSFFDFLFRKTDFFYECDPGDKMGFPPGYSERMLVGIFRKFQEQHYKRFPKKDADEFDKKMQKFKQGKEKKTQTTAQEQKKPEKKPEVKQQKPKPAEQKKQPSKPIIDTYNGGTNDKYSWSQQSHDVEVTIEIQPHLNSKMINVQIKNTSISICQKTGEKIISGELYEKINAGDSYWRIDKSGNRSFIILNLEKAQDKIWNTVFKGDQEIDTTKVNNTKALHEFDGQTQGAIRKIMYEQQRKQMGLPTTEQQSQLDALKQAWDADGSPFKGQPFDPSKFNLQGGQFKPQ